MSWRRVVPIVGVIGALVLGSPPARAADATLDEVARLAEAASTDDAARMQLESITSIDGTPVDLSHVFDGDAVDIDRRLATLADLEPESSQLDTESARNDAAAILSGREYQRVDPAPGIAERIAEWLANLVPDSVAAALSNSTLWLFIAVATLGVGLFFFARNYRRKRLAGSREGSRAQAGSTRRATAVEERAREAAAAGNYSLAVRLWFEAGAMRLADQGIVPHESTSTSGVIRRAVPSATMTHLAATFDQVAYGRRAASHDDAVAAEHGWESIRSEVAHRG